ncbi:uncharacterized protein J7T54_000490 [Emericellopsis cladophorae]|uniref:FAD-binding PCMH-type domain-containing protein n=1 Tax=Emericellopsis cladophorae TaxID=2686198 RepID=A0A9Q0BAI8_9HYPO|nr:uncharacterized protein J7T54_000490 [Emericellopsis cladophorae]KAI6778372.1 hypothetical protein J7T54_000490 [Emericellopsis cladophorae]
MKFSNTALALTALAADWAAAGSIKPSCQCCKALATAPSLVGKVWAPNDERYDARLAEYYSANAAQAPWCMVLPESTEDVSALMKVLTQYSCPFGMRSGAHTAFQGGNGIKDGVTVDFGHLNVTTYDESTQVASMNPGQTWGDAYKVLADYSVVAIGGRADVVGVGGFTTGGGYSFHTGVRGFACDNVVNFEVVLGDGSIVNANAEENHDLWVALKGGSGNFGFVTRIDQKVWPSSEIYANLNSYSIDKRPEVRQRYYDFVNKQDDEPESQIIGAMSYADGAWACAIIMSNINAEISDVFDPFFEVESTTSVPATGPAHEVVPIFTGPTPLGLYANWQTGMVDHNLEIMEAMDEIVMEYFNKAIGLVEDGENKIQLIWQWQPVTQGIVDVMQKQGGNVLGLDATVVDGPVIMYNIVFTADTEETQAATLPTIFALNQAILAKADELGHNKHWQFLNYAHGSQDPISHYGADNIALMKAVSAKYDQGQVFQNLRQTGFKLPA